MGRLNAFSWTSEPQSNSRRLIHHLALLCAIVFTTETAAAQLIVPPEPLQSNSSTSPDPARDNAPSRPVAKKDDPAQDESPSALVLHVPNSVRAGEWVSVQIEAENIDQDACIGTLAICIEDGQAQVKENRPQYDLILPGPHSKLARFTRQDGHWVFGPASGFVTPRFTHIELYDKEWPGRTTRRLVFDIQFQQAGEATLLCRATFARRDGKITVVQRNIPDESEHLDEQGLPCTRQTIKVHQ